MNRDSYHRFLRSDIYRDSLLNAKKKVSILLNKDVKFFFTFAE